MTKAVASPNYARKNECNVVFWMKRIREHMLFINKLLDNDVVPVLKCEAYELYSELSNDISYNEHILLKIYSLLEFIHTRSHELGKLDVNINKRLMRQDFNALVKHMLQEQTYIVRLYNGKLSFKEEFLFWLEESIEHLTLLSKLINELSISPESQNLLADFNDLINNLQEVHDYLMLSIDLSEFTSFSIPDLLSRSKLLTTQLKMLLPQDLQSADDIMMIDHETIETEFAMTRLPYLFKSLSQ